jgi:hypothetical protein
MPDRKEFVKAILGALDGLNLSESFFLYQRFCTHVRFLLDENYPWENHLCDLCGEI